MFRTILVPLDNSADSAAAVPVARTGRVPRAALFSCWASSQRPPKPRPEIIRAANRVDADLVVMSTHSIAWPGQAYLDSVADGVVARGRPALLLRREPPAGVVGSMPTANAATIC